ncbi:MAG: ATP-dependent helicase/nuclease subunit A [Halieaceae bacterium]
MSSAPTADVQQRERALDTRGSFCVTAPAGSGKTEILTQRMLALLATVQIPEQVLAITFTRKAAAEMRGRIVAALNAAEEGLEASSPHDQRKLELAHAVLNTDRRLNWNLRDNPGRLRILTIDGLCMQLARQLPILSRFGSSMTVADDPWPIYERAAQSTLASVNHSGSMGTSVRTVLESFHNDWRGLQNMFTQMLARRDQWLQFLAAGAGAGTEDMTALIRESVRLLIDDHFSQLQAQLKPFAGEMAELGHFAAETLAKSEPESPLRGLAQLDALVIAEPLQVTVWRSLASFWLTTTGTWRKSWTIKQGLTAKSDKERGAESNAYKVRAAQLRDELEAVPGLREMLAEVFELPDPAGDLTNSVQISALLRTLTLLAAELMVEFQAVRQVDYAQVALAARQALGDELAPTDLALKLDYQLQHILVDEFQDTSSGQFALLEQLTSGWSEQNAADSGNAKTLFIVGDSMQSIYGFRDANVALFRRSEESGINGIALESLQLQTNFRSTAGLVNWVNAVFDRQKAPSVRDHSYYFPAVSHQTAASDSDVQLFGFGGENARQLEAARVAEIAQAAIADNTCHSLAILIRSRSHLQWVLPALEAEGISWLAIDIDPLAQRAVIIDLMILYRALHNPADRIAWLAVLRAPWCGLQIGDLDILSHPGAGAQRTSIWGCIQQRGSFLNLSGAALKRLDKVATVLGAGLTEYHRIPLRLLLERTWLGLGGPGTVTDDQALDDAEEFFRLLEQLESGPKTLNPDYVQRKLDGLYAGPDSKTMSEDPACRIEVMTLHKSKGLEFDWVVMPGLERSGRSDSKSIMEWRDYTARNGEQGLMLAIRSGDRAQEDSALYSWLAYDRRARAKLELRRLMYVGTTRAARKLFLLAAIEVDEKKEGHFVAPKSGSLLATVWPEYAETMSYYKDDSQALVASSTDDSSPDVSAEAPGNRVRRLEDTWFSRAVAPSQRLLNPADSEERGDIANWAPEFDRDARAVGIAVHAGLEYLVLSGNLPDSFVMDESWAARLTMSLREMGIEEPEWPRLLKTVVESLSCTLADQVGRWMLSNEHRESRVELPVQVTELDQKSKLLIIDRCFIAEDGIRWIVDYKTSAPASEETLENFLVDQTQKYSGQLNAYRDALLRIGDVETKVALYFTALAHLQELD